MATKALPDFSLPDVTDFDLIRDSMRIYGTEVNLNRSVPDLTDGMKPVHRKILVAMLREAGLTSKMLKAGRVIGTTIGLFSPHGDAGTKVAMDTLVNQHVPPLHGEGNWGGITSNSGAMRYINAAFNNYGKSFFVPDYMAVVPKVPNYDGSTTEPLYLPALLPNILLNWNEGIGVGIRTLIPSFSPDSLLPIMAAMLRGQKFTPEELAKKLVFTHPHGGRILRTPSNLAAVKELFKGTSGKLLWTGDFTADFARKEIVITKYPPNFDPVKVVDEKIKLLEDVDKVGTGKGVSYIVRAHKQCTREEFDALTAKIRKILTKSISYFFFVTERKLKADSDDSYEVLFHNLTIHQIMVRWLKWRIKLEADSLDYQIGKIERAIHILKLLRLAALNLDVIKWCLEQENSALAMVKKLKISIDDANLLLDRKLRNLSKLDQRKINEKLKGAEGHLAALQKKRKQPKEEVAKFLENAATLFEPYEQWSGTYQQALTKNLAPSVKVQTEEGSDSDDIPTE